MNAAAFTEFVPHLLRPWWMLAWLALPLLWWLQRRRAGRDTPWQHAVDAHLLPALLQKAPPSKQRGAWFFAAAYAIAVCALAGPSWKQLPVQLYAPSAPLVVVMDMSSHMLAADLKPSRVLRERLKVEQLIAQRKGGQLGLVAYAGDAFTVAPISDDPNSLRDLLAALTPDTMPVDGQRADLAILRAAKLLSQAGYKRGQILLLTDAVNAAAQSAARDVSVKGYSVDTLGIGTPTGAPLPSADGTFAQDASGDMQIARLDAASLRTLARDGGGSYADLRSDTSDLTSLGVLDSAATSAVQHGDAESLRWRDDGPFLLLALLPLAAFGFRRGWLAVALLAVMVMPMQPATAKAETAQSATDQPVTSVGSNWWSALWQRPDQRADHALRAGDAKAASALAQTPDQRAAAAYRNGNFSDAAREWNAGKNADVKYNFGNALAQMKQYQQALDAYKSALQSSPQMADAQANLKLVEQLLRKQQQQQNGQQKNQQQKSGQQGQQNQQQASQKGQQKRDQNGQSKNKENEQQSKQQAQQQGQQQAKDSQENQQSAQKKGEQDKDRQASAQQDKDQQGKDKQQPSQQQPKPDQAAQAKADAAQQRAMQQALQKAKQDGNPSKQPVAVAKESNAKREKREAIESLLQRVPDDPGGLLRAKFALEYARRQQENDP